MISVAMATYNGEKYLKEQLLSIISQTQKPDEIVINDDCSTDGTEEVVKEVSLLTEIPIFYERNERQLGFAENFRRAIRRTKGDIIFLSDQDDIWLCHKIELSVSVLEKRNDILALSTGFVFFHDKGVPAMPLGISDKEEAQEPVRVLWEQFIRHPKYPGMAMVFRRSLWPKIDAMVWGERFAHDWMINQYAASVGGMYQIGNKTVLYRQHENNTEGVIINRSKKTVRSKREKLILALIDEMEAIHPLEQERAAFLVQAIQFQKERCSLLHQGKLMKLFLYEIHNLQYITLRSIMGDIYVCLKSAR